ncbi:hypothetical protein [Nannocystis radixulma]|uniref:Uncharacterized protein n=1 Tax=Nannocystis radixulma TaxID=2995305 RepID=A0ABT5BQV2_9BACT|nr:hypothetical protein [Nannocystis radixulma]MDC0675306.1 hypothetical protein [Nannocystis radixulma]
MDARPGSRTRAPSGRARSRPRRLAGDAPRKLAQLRPEDGAPLWSFTFKGGRRRGAWCRSTPGRTRSPCSSRGSASSTGERLAGIVDGPEPELFLDAVWR